jgi:hypothetical protein
MAISAKLTVLYHVTEGRKPIRFYEYPIDGGVRRFVPVYSEANRSKAEQFWKLNWDAPDLLGIMED